MKKRNSEFEQQAAEQAESSGSRIFDFTGPTVNDDDRTAYFLLRRRAILAGNETLFPDGKTYTEAEVIKLLGEDYASFKSDTKCCG